MEIKSKKRYRSTITLSVLLLSVAISMIIAYMFDLYYWIIAPPIVLLIVGFWSIILGVLVFKENSSEFIFGPKESTYLMVLGSLMSITGFLLLFHGFYPEVNLMIHVAIFILFVGIILLLTSILPYRKSRSE